MLDRTKRRLLYGVTATLAAGLAYGGFIWDPKADFSTSLGQVDTQLRFAAAIPERGKDGKVLSTRVDLLRSSSEILARLHASAPGDPMVAEYRAYLAWLEKRYLDAAKIYQEARGLEDCTPEMRRCFELNESRMLRDAGRTDEALSVLQKAGPANDLDAGVLFEELGDTKSASEIFDAVAPSDVRGTYLAARLKMKTGAVDIAVAGVEGALGRDPLKAVELIRKDRSFWLSKVGKERLEHWLATASSATPSGR